VSGGWVSGGWVSGGWVSGGWVSRADESSRSARVWSLISLTQTRACSRTRLPVTPCVYEDCQDTGKPEDGLIRGTHPCESAV